MGAYGIRPNFQKWSLKKEKTIATLMSGGGGLRPWNVHSNGHKLRETCEELRGNCGNCESVTLSEMAEKIAMA